MAAKPDMHSYRNSRGPRWRRGQSAYPGRRYNAPQAGRELPIDKVLLAIVLGLVLFGAVMVYSASAVLAQKEFVTGLTSGATKG